MVSLIIGAVNVSAHITDYGVRITPVEDSGNSFIDYTGKENKAILGLRTSISVTLKKVPSSLATSLAAVVESEEFSVTYSTPVTATSNFSCSNYDAVRFCPNASTVLWNINLTLDSTDLTAVTSADSL